MIQKTIKQSRRMLLAASLVSVLASASLPAHGSLIHWWTFDEANGTASPQLKDTALGGTRHGKFAGALTDASRSADVPAGIGSTRSLDFGAANTINYADVYNSPAGSFYLDMPTAGDWSISLWYRGPVTEVGGAVQTNVLIGSGAGHANLELRTVGGAAKVVYTHFNGTYQDNVISSVSVNDNVWHNITLVHYGATQKADLYVDAVAQVTGVSATISTATPYKIGSFMTGPGTAGNYTSGKLDDVRIYNNTLTQADVNVLANVPEPMSLAVLAGGAALILGRRRRV